MDIKGVKITKEILDHWIQKVTPMYDLFFFTDENKSLIDHFDSNILVMTAKDFYQDDYFNDFDTFNSYQSWQISKEVTYVCIAHPESISRLETNVRNRVFRIQKEVNSGLVYNWNIVSNHIEDIQSPLQKESINQLLSLYRFDFETNQYLILQNSLWIKLNLELKYAFLSYIATNFVHEVDLNSDRKLSFIKEYPHIAPFFNTFSDNNGANCLAATLAASSGSNSDTKWLITKWVSQYSFLYNLKSNGYTLKSETLIELSPKDVLVWRDGNDKVLHATYYLGDGYFFNKHGQSFINPWQIITLDNLLEIWGKDRINVYRQMY
ncbi:hypothetical protein [Ureibacillus manganicus]|uniref:NlpC/P60 domain-containing protein n=1 Tax=Ureibacillus manganicus DSM 26584 TaxID=1384049 RepID=A0A0A3I224_9BACL|nr:hypothetical protein [Ureibacillus manganicus]KGR78851.1 hypothetical protein CD29_09235 [Ureibacillus manganicus DSM 26584]